MFYKGINTLHFSIVLKLFKLLQETRFLKTAEMQYNQLNIF